MWVTDDNSAENRVPNTSSNNIENSSTWDVLYRSQLWSDSNLRRTFINEPLKNNINKSLKYCYTCRGKIRKYEIKSLEGSFAPDGNSTPNGKIFINNTDVPLDKVTHHLNDDHYNTQTSIEMECRNRDLDEGPNIPTVKNINECIPTISYQIDSRIGQNCTSCESSNDDAHQTRLRKSFTNIGCIVHFSSTNSPVKKRTQIQACSISLMIVAIIVISFVLVNFTIPKFTHRTSDINSTTIVPTLAIVFNQTSLAISSLETTNIEQTNITEVPFVTAELEQYTTTEIKRDTLHSKVLPDIRKKIKVFLKSTTLTNRDLLSQKFCSCQTNEICMLDESTGTAICKAAVDVNDPTGCGGLCALETEACHLVDRRRGVRVCRLLTLVTCSEREWRCKNGICVSAEARCDGIIQCYDKSDEMHCECDLTKEFRCGHSISCFANSKRCDGIIDCWDGHDELNCTIECPQDQFTCTDGQCITSSRFCDGFVDCADGSDEPHGCDIDCGNNELRCRNGRCVTRNTVCDGHDNCGDASDEILCSGENKQTTQSLTWLNTTRDIFTR